MKYNVFENIKYVYSKQSKRDKTHLYFTAGLLLTLFFARIFLSLLNNMPLDTDHIWLQALGMFGVGVWIFFLLTLGVLGAEREKNDR